MEYKIGEMAKLFNISKEMVRYYEKCGVITPKRSKDNNYRVYTTSDFFMIGEIIQLQQFGVNIKDSKELRAKNFVGRMIDNYSKFSQELNQEIDYKKILKRRTEEMIDNLETVSLNSESYWVKRIDSRTDYYYETAYGDEYQGVEAPLEVSQWFLSPRYAPFCDAIAVFKDDCIEWNFSIQDQYGKAFQLPSASNLIHVPSQICVCTVIDMGDFGTFTKDYCIPLLEYAKKRGYIINGEIYGVLRARGIEDKKFCRYMELRLPIKNNKGI